MSSVFSKFFSSFSKASQRYLKDIFINLDMLSITNSEVNVKSFL